jgi:hypothetical protein
MKPKPPTNYRALRGTTERNLVIGFFVIIFVIGAGLIGYFYGGGALVGALSCIFAGAGLLGVVALVLAGLGKLSEWLDRDYAEGSRRKAVTACRLPGAFCLLNEQRFC